MAAVPGFRHDVFVSYAHADNQAVAGTDVGFVSQLVLDLRIEVGRKVGKTLEIWWDHNKLSGNTVVSSEIMSAAGDSACIVVVLSPAYLRSEWCERERGTFDEQVGRRQSNDMSAIFLVSIDPVDQDKLPVALRDRTGYPFYRSLDDGRTTRPLRVALEPDKEPYYNRLSQLVQDISNHLERLLQRFTPATPSAADRAPTLSFSTLQASKPCALLLEVTDDLVQRRAELKDYLEQSGIVVLPEKRYSRDDMTLHRNQILADLARSRACVQILGPLTGDRDDHPRGIVWFRHETVRASGTRLPFIQWRDPDLDLGAVTDTDARELLAPPSVRIDRFPDLRRAVAELVLKPPERVRPEVQRGVTSVFVNSDLLDREFGRDVARWLEDRGFMVLEPPNATPDAREEWETNVRYCDSLILVYGQTKPAWVKTQILLTNKVQRDTPLGLLCVCVGPPPGEPARDKVEDLALRYAGIHYVRNEHARTVDRAEMEKFVGLLRGPAHA